MTVTKLRLNIDRVQNSGSPESGLFTWCLCSHQKETTTDSETGSGDVSDCV